jgi:hypothetical protein
MRFVLRHLELILSAAGLAVIFAIPALFFRHGSRYLPAMAITAIAVGLLHGVIFWLVRQRQRRVRKETIAQLQAMLLDVINNKLTIVLAAQSAEVGPQDRVQLQEKAQASLASIQALLRDLSEETLLSWRQRYAR